MKKYTFTFCILLAYFSLSLAYSQQTGSSLNRGLSNINQPFSPSNRLAIFNPSKLPTVPKGTSAYINENYLPVKITQFKEVYSARYNAYNEIMEIIKSGESKPIGLNIKNLDYELTFINTNKTYRSLYYMTDDGNRDKKFFVLVSESENKGDISLYLREKIDYIPPVKATSGYDKNQPAKFKRQKDAYYITRGDNTLTKVPTRKKEIAKLFSDREKEVLSFIKRDKIKLNKEGDLIKLINFLNQ